MLSDKEIRDLYDKAYLGGADGRVETFASAVIAAYQSKLLAGVGMPEYKYIDRHDVPKEGMCVYTADQLQQYAAAAAAQARMKALEEVTDLLREYDMTGSSFSMDVADLRWKP